MATRLALEVSLTVPPGLEAQAAAQAYEVCRGEHRTLLVDFCLQVIARHEQRTAGLCVIANLDPDEAAAFLPKCLPVGR